MWNALLSKPKTFKRLLDVARLEPTNVLYYIVNVQMRSENQQMNTCVLKCVGAIVLTKLRNKAAYKLNIYILCERTARSASRNAFEMYLYTFGCIKYIKDCVCVVGHLVIWSVECNLNGRVIEKGEPTGTQIRHIANCLPAVYQNVELIELDDTIHSF